MENKGQNWPKIQLFNYVCLSAALLSVRAGGCILKLQLMAISFLEHLCCRVKQSGMESTSQRIMMSANYGKESTTCNTSCCRFSFVHGCNVEYDAVYLQSSLMRFGHLDPANVFEKMHFFFFFKQQLKCSSTCVLDKNVKKNNSARRNW